METNTERDELIENQSIELSTFRQQAIRIALSSRLVEEKLIELYQAGKISGTIHTCLGQEFIASALHLCTREADYVFSHHRCHGHFLGCTDNATGLFSEILGAETGVCGGKGGSQHLQLGNFFSNGIVAGMSPVAAGAAFRQKLTGADGVTILIVGDGALGQGVFYETLNIASLWRLPLLIVVENNRIAQSSDQEQYLAGKIESRAAAFGLPSRVSNTKDWKILLDDFQDSVLRVRTLRSPLVHRIDTQRLGPHSKGDDHRAEEQLNQYRKSDPLTCILDNRDNIKDLPALIESTSREIEHALEDALRVAAKKRDGRTRPRIQTHPGHRHKPSTSTEVQWISSSEPRNYEDTKGLRMAEAINRALSTSLSEHEDLIVLGEDIESPYGGAFKCTRDLSEAFPGRVKNTPISESAIVGIGSGLALSGMMAVVEIMFGDFLSLAFDQLLNHAAKFQYMFNMKRAVRLIIRAPMGGKRGYGPTHSQSLEKHFLGIPGTQILYLNYRSDPQKIYEALTNTIQLPTLVIENKPLYSTEWNAPVPIGYELLRSAALFPIARLKPIDPGDVTIVATGQMGLEIERLTERLFEEHEVFIDLFLPVNIYPLDISFLVDSLRETRKLLIVEEGQGFASMSSELVAQIIESFHDLHVRCRRVYAAPTPIPASPILEASALPSEDSILEAILELVDE